MKKDLIDTIMEKQFHELNSAEREEIQEFCATEDEFNQAREVFISVEAMNFEQPTPKVETKQRLDELFVQTYPKVAPIWYMSLAAVVVPKEKPFYRQPLMQIAAIGLLFLLVYPMWNSEVLTEKPTSELASTEVKPAEKPSAPTESPAAEISSTSENFKTEPTVVAYSKTGPADLNLQATIPGQATPVDEKHPDGVYIAYSQPASDAPDMLDLLTTTF